MKKTKLTQAYSKALYSLARQDSCVEKVLQDCTALLSLIKKDKAFSLFFSSNSNSLKEQKKVLNLIFEKMNLHNVTQNFLSVLADNKRFFLLADIIQHTFFLEDKSNKILKGSVVSVTALNEENKKDLEASLVDKFKANIQIEYTEDPSLAEGFVVKIAGHSLNTSFNNKMDNLTKHIKRNISF